MQADDVKALRKELACTARELAETLKLEQRDVMAWEKGDTFPTKAKVVEMEALRAKGPTAIVRKSKGGSDDPFKLLADDKLWLLIRKLMAHKKLREAVLKLADGYDDPAL